MSNNIKREGNEEGNIASNAWEYEPSIAALMLLLCQLAEFSEFFDGILGDLSLYLDLT